MRLLFSLLLSLFSLLAQAAPGDSVRVVVAGDSLVVENAAVRRVVAFSRSAGPVVPTSIYDRIARREALTGRTAPAWFEVHVGGRPVTSRDAVWSYQDHSVRKMQHGGSEVTLNLVARSGPAAGLRVRYILQAYPGATVFRERLELSADAASTLRLTKAAGKLDVVFPRYGFARPSTQAPNLREIRLATWAGELLEDAAAGTSYDERSEAGLRENADLSQNYMYHPRRIDLPASARSSHKGPILVNRLAGGGQFVAYEHGSPDDKPEQTYILLDQETTGASVNLSARAERGIYFDGEPLNRPFRTWWAEVGLFRGNNYDAAEAVVWDFVHDWLAENRESREPVYFYNTWGMQRDEQKKKGGTPQPFLTTERVLQEINNASELGVDMFVLDDGWQDYLGSWTPNAERLPQGLAPIKQALDQKGMLFGIWMGPIHIQQNSALAAQHPEWLIKDDQGKPIVGRWTANVACLVSDYYDHLIAQTIKLIDAGARHFKWDGVDTGYEQGGLYVDHMCSSPDHDHGDASQTPAERKARYGYEFANRITQAIAELKAYNPDVVIEFDATEPDRNIGLAILSEAKYFWMNNGASWYGDRSQFRVKSMRMGPNLYHDLLPPVLMSYNNYPHQDRDFRAQRYSVNTSILGGGGLWGDLSEMTPEQRRRVGETLNLARRVRGSALSVRPEVIGGVGASPEIYTMLDRSKGEGQVIGFSGSALAFRYATGGLRTDSVLAIVRNAYEVKGDSLIVPFQFNMPDATREAFVLSNGGRGISVTASTSWLRDARLTNRGALVFVNGAPGVHRIRVRGGRPAVTSSKPVTTRPVSTAGGYTILEITTTQPDIEITVTPAR